MSLFFEIYTLDLFFILSATLRYNADWFYENKPPTKPESSTPNNR